MSHVTRRKFLKTTLATVGSMGVARTSLGQRPFSKPRGANDDVRVAVPVLPLL